jgi:hypothetical protein
MRGHANVRSSPLRESGCEGPRARRQSASRKARQVIEITAIRLKGGDGHEHITDLQWQSTAIPAGQSTRQALVEWLNASSENQAVVAGEAEHVPVLVVAQFDKEPYLRTHTDGTWTNHLLGLSRF